MDPFFFLLIGFGLGTPLVMKALFHATICWKEWLAQTVGVTLVLVLAFFIAHNAQTSDVRITNGEITDKRRDMVSCSHSYSCNCKTTTNANGDSTTRCETCYEHSHDYDWVLLTTVGSITVNRVDRQGLRQPPRYTAAKAGDPVAMREAWTNYIKAAPHSVFHNTPIDTYDDQIPAYPDKIHDYHYLDRVFVTGTAHLPDYDQWNRALAERLKTIGAAVRGNVVVVVTDTLDPAYPQALEQAWLRGKSNDTVVVLVVDGDTIVKVNAFGWSSDPMLYIQLRDQLENTALNRETTLATIEATVVAHFVPLPADHFAYLASDIVLPAWLYAFLGLLAVALSGGTTWYFHHNDPFFPRSSFQRTPRLNPRKKRF